MSSNNEHRNDSHNESPSESLSVDVSQNISQNASVINQNEEPQIDFTVTNELNTNITENINERIIPNTSDNMNINQNDVNQMNDSAQYRGTSPTTEQMESAQDRLDSNEDFKHELRFIVLNSVCGSLIGKGGDCIKATNDRHSVHVSIPVTHTDIRSLVITGKRSCILEALKELIPKFKAAPVHAFDKKEININLLIPDGLAPILIGTKGTRVGTLRKETKCSVKVFDHNLPSSNERLVLIAGSLDGIISVLSTVMDLYEKSRFERNVRRVNCQRLYREDLEGGLNFDHGPGNRHPQNMRFPPRMNQPMYNPPYDGPARPLMQEYDVPMITTQVSIPLEHAKFIIGPRGSNIRRIEQMSRCKIHLEDPKPDCSIRIISITGTGRDINDAEYYLQQTIMDHQNPRRRRNP